MMRPLILGATLALVALCACVPSATATVDGPCQGTVAGRSVAGLSASDPADAVVVGPDDVVPYSFTANSDVTHYDTEVSYGPYTGTVDDGAPEESDTGAEGTLDVSQFSQFGVGLYQVEAHAALADGSTCSATFLLHVDGGVLSSSVGQVAAVLALLAGGGVIAISAMAASGAKTILVSLKAAL